MGMPLNGSASAAATASSSASWNSIAKWVFGWRKYLSATMAVVVWLEMLLCTLLVQHAASSSLGAEFTAFETWMDDKGFVAHPSVSIRQDVVSGYGLYADATLASGTVVATIPLSAVVNVEHAMVDDTTGPLWQALDDLSDLDIFTGWMAYQMAHLDNDSPWLPYFNTLPHASLTSPLLLTKQQLDHYSLSAIIDMVNQRNFSMASVRELT
jgi:hypothetical protein